MVELTGPTCHKPSLELHRTESMKKYILTLPLIALSLLASSCLQHHVEISLNKDGSGIITEETSFGAQMLAMLGQAPGGADEAIAGMIAEAKATSAKKAAVMGEGVTLKSVEPIKDGGRKGTVVTYAFKDINKLKYEAGGEIGGGMGGEEEEIVAPENPIQFSYKDGTLTMVNEEPEKDGAEEPAEGGDEEMSDQELAMAKQMMGDMRISIKLNFPGGIAKTNASHVDGNKVTIMDMPMGKLLENPEKFKELNKAQPETPAEMIKILDGVEGVVIEPESKISGNLTNQSHKGRPIRAPFSCIPAFSECPISPTPPQTPCQPARGTWLIRSSGNPRSTCHGPIKRAPLLTSLFPFWHASRL